MPLRNGYGRPLGDEGGLDFILRFPAMAESEQAPLCSFGLMKTFNFMLFYGNYLIFRLFIVSLQPETKITIMTQILVTLNENATTLHVRKAIELLRGVVSTTVFKTKDESNKKTLRQQAYVKKSLERAFDEMKQARREGRKLQSADDFIKELDAEEAV